MSNVHVTLQELYTSNSRLYFNMLFGVNRDLFDAVFSQYPITMADAALACRIVTPVYPIIVNRVVFEERLNQLTTGILSQITELGNTVTTPQTRKHKREYGQRESTDDDTVTSTDDAAEDKTRGDAYFSPTTVPQYNVEPTSESVTSIGQRKRTDDVDRKHIEKAHTDVEYEELTDWDMVKQISDFRSRAVDLFIQWLSDTITASREWGVNGV